MNTIVKGVCNNLINPNQKIVQARVAYEKNDIESSRFIHNSLLHEEQHSTTQSELLKVIVFGGLDGIVTIFSLVSGCVAAGFTTVQIFTICMGSLLADAFAMSVGEYVGSKAEKDFVESEHNREKWEVENCPEEEKLEMFHLYQSKHGFSKEDAEKMVTLTFKYKEFFISHMMMEELGLICNDDDSSQPSPLKTATFMFFSFALFGLIPMVSFISFNHLFSLSDLLSKYSHLLSYTTVCLCCASALAILGYIKGKFCNISPLKSAFTMLISGLVSGIVSYSVAKIFAHLTS